MQKEYGSNFCEELNKGADRLEDGHGKIFFDSGRSALRYLLDALGTEIKSVMLPQYNCESVFEPFIKRAYEINYYPLDRNLRPCAGEFERLVRKVNPQLILVQSYFGFDTLAGERDFLAGLREQGVIVVEDITHRLFMTGVTECSDYRFASLRKWCQIPDGGVLLGLDKNNTPGGGGLKENTPFVDMRLEAQRLKRAFIACETEQTDKSFIALYYESERILDSQEGCYTMSSYTRDRITALDCDGIILRRRDNYSALNEALSRAEGLEKVFDGLDGNAVPLYFPIYIKNGARDELRMRMRRKNIFLPVIWPVPPMLKDISGAVSDIYDMILAVPCDQRYSREEMMYIAGEIKSELKFC